MKRSLGVSHDFPDKEPACLIRLRELISSLTVPEKALFKRHLRSYKGDSQKSTYVQLFDCVNDCLVEHDQHDSQSEQTILAPVPDTFYQKFVVRYRLRRLGRLADLYTRSHHLFDRILDALRHRGNQDMRRRELYALMLDIHLLFQKNLLVECLRKIDQAQDIALAIEAHGQVLELAQLESLLLPFSRQDKNVRLKQIHDVELIHLKHVDINIHLSNLSWELYLFRLDPGDLDVNFDLQEKINYVRTYILDNPSQLTFEKARNSQNIMNHLLAIWQVQPASTFLTALLSPLEQKTAVEYRKAIIDLYKIYPQRKMEKPGRYRDDLFNYLLTAIGTKSYIKIEDYKAELNQIPTTDPNFSRHLIYFWLSYYVQENQFAAATEFLKKYAIWELFKQKEQLIPASRRETIRYMAGAVYFVQEAYSKAIQWFAANNTLGSDISHVEAQRMSLLYELLARFEIGIPAKLVTMKALRTAFPHKSKNDSVEQHVLSTVKAVLQAGNHPALLQDIATKSLPVLEAKLADQSGHIYGVFLGWLKSKMTRRPLVEVIGDYI